MTSQTLGPFGQPSGGWPIARDIPDSYFQVACYQTRSNVQSGAIPQGYHAVANYRWVTGMRNVYAIQRQQNMDLASRIAEVIHNQFGLKLKEQSSMYRHPYPAYFDRVPLPNRYKMPDFSKFSG